MTNLLGLCFGLANFIGGTGSYYGDRFVRILDVNEKNEAIVQVCRIYDSDTEFSVVCGYGRQAVPVQMKKDKPRLILDDKVYLELKECPKSKI